jgi:dihydroorotase
VTTTSLGSTAQPVTAVDPDSGGRPGTLQVDADGSVTLVPTAAPGSTGEMVYITPGWVDLHTHVFHGSTQISIRPDRAGLETGVHLVADAGSAGQMTVRGLIDYVMPTARTPVRIWLNIGSHGLVHLRETADPSFIDVDATIAAVHAAGEAVCGIKVRSSGAIVGGMGLQPLALGRLVAREVGLPLMVHIGEAPPVIDDVLELLDEGDVVTHCFHGKTGRPWLPDGTPIPALRAALDRGVLLDVGHGAASFDAVVARAAVAAGFAPTTISTDIHVRNAAGPVYDLAGVMTKMLDCGMDLPAVIEAVTAAPRRVLRQTAPSWIRPDGRVVHATIFRMTDHPPAGRHCVDAAGRVLSPTRHIVPVGIVVDGTYRPVEAEPAH